jgi:hypothetical protein
VWSIIKCYFSHSYFLLFDLHFFNSGENFFFCDFEVKFEISQGMSADFCLVLVGRVLRDHGFIVKIGDQDDLGNWVSDWEFPRESSTFTNWELCHLQ